MSNRRKAYKKTKSYYSVKDNEYVEVHSLNMMQHLVRRGYNVVKITDNPNSCSGRDFIFRKRVGIDKAIEAYIFEARNGLPLYKQLWQAGMEKSSGTDIDGRRFFTK